MKKFLTLFVILCLMFSGCESENNPNPRPTPVEENKTVISRNLINYIFPLEEDKSELTQNINQSLLTNAAYRFMDSTTQNNIFDYNLQYRLASVEKVDNNNVILTISFENTRRKKIDLSFDGVMIYPKESFNYLSTNGMNIYWGDVTVYDDEFIVSSLKATEIYSRTDFSKTGVTLDYSFFGDEDYYIVDVNGRKGGYVAAFISKSTQGILLFDDEGKMVHRKDLTDDNCKPYHVFGCMKDGCFENEKRNISLELYRNEAVERAGDFVIVYTYNGYKAPSLIYNYTTGELYERSTNSNRNTAVGNYDFIRMRSAEGPYSIQNETTKGLAILGDGDDRQAFSFDLDKTDDIILSKLTNAPTRLTVENNVVMHYSKFADAQIYFDFNNKTVKVVYPATPTDNTVVATKNGYTIYESDSEGTGEGLIWKVYLRENSTGKIKYLDTVGGEYAQICESGFFSNGDVYVFSGDGMKIFDTDMNNKNHIFKLGDNFTFGANISDDIHQRILLAARRDPVDKTYLAVYFEQPYYKNTADMYKNGNAEDTFLKATYKVGYFDKDGRIVNVYETGQNVSCSYSGANPVIMQLSGTDTVNFYSYFRDIHNVTAKGSLNLKTRIYISKK